MTADLLAFGGYLAGPVMAAPVSSMLLAVAVNAALAVGWFWEVRA